MSAPSSSTVHDPLKVAIVAPSLGILGGQAVQADRLLRAWDGDPAVHSWLVPINPVAPGPFRAAQRVKYLRTLVTQATYWPRLLAELGRADIVHVFSASYFSFVLSPWPAIRVARLLGKPVLLNYRSGQAPDHLARSPLARRTLASVDVNVVPSQFLRDVFAGFGISATIVPNVVDVDRFAYRERRPLRPRLISTRNFESLYNVSCTLRAFQLIQRRWPDASLTLVGDGSEQGALRTLAAELQLRNVEFVGRVAPEDIARYYASADIYVQTPDIDNMPSSVLEAWSSGLPVVATEAGGVPAIVTDGVNGLLTPLNDHESVAGAVLDLLESPDTAADLALNGRRACDAYTWPAVRDQWLRVYRSLVAVPGLTNRPVHAK